MYRESEINPGFQRLLPEFRNYPRIALARAHHVTCAQYNAVQLAGRSRRGFGYFVDEKAFLRNIQRFSCDFRLDVMDFGKKCEIKGNKEKSRESGGSGQGKQPWGVGRYVRCPEGWKFERNCVLLCHDAPKMSFLASGSPLLRMRKTDGTSTTLSQRRDKDIVATSNTIT